MLGKVEEWGLKCVEKLKLGSEWLFALPRRLLWEEAGMIMQARNKPLSLSSFPF